MRRFSFTRAALVGLLLAATIVGLTTGRFGLTSLYTHCGIRFADFNGTRYYADPPLDDGKGNPPAGWGNPAEGGFIVVTDSDHAVYIWFFHAATFSRHPKAGIPAIPVCS